ncbi:hypothetical protein ACFL6Y_11580 [Elusimicrobiota bacterium]
MKKIAIIMCAFFALGTVLAWAGDGDGDSEDIQINVSYSWAIKLNVTGPAGDNTYDFGSVDLGNDSVSMNYLSVANLSDGSFVDYQLSAKIDTPWSISTDATTDSEVNVVMLKGLFCGDGSAVTQPHPASFDNGSITRNLISTDAGEAWSDGPETYEDKVTSCAGSVSDGNHLAAGTTVALWLRIQMPYYTTESVNLGSGRNLNLVVTAVTSVSETE